MTGQIVHDYDVGCSQRRNEELLDPGLEDLSGDGSVEDERSDDAFQSQSGHDGSEPYLTQ
jgi:hypothetical protein